MSARPLALFGCVCALVAASYAAAVASTTPDSFVVARDEATTSTPLEGPSEGPSKEEGPTTEGPLPPIKVTELDVTSVIRMRYAHTAVVTSVRNPAKRSQEATIRIIIPDTSFITGLVMTLGGKSYRAYVKEKEEAKQIYSDAVSQGVGAAHVAAKARDSNHFTVSVNVEANSMAMFNLTYEELLFRRNKVYNHAINMHPGGVVPKMKITVHIKESEKITELRVPEVRTGNEIDATEEDAQNSIAHVERCHDDREATITFEPDLVEQKKLMDVYAQKAKESQSQSRPTYYGQPEEPKEIEGVLGQFVVQYDVDRPADGEILVNDGYFVHFFAPSSLPPLSKHVVFVLDTSGSMMDRKITQLRDAMQTILSELNPGDYFSIVEFASSVKVYDLKEADEPAKKITNNYFWNEERPVTLVPPAPATPDNIAKAKVIVKRLSANGGTNINGALNIAMDLVQKGVGWTQAVVATPAPSPPSNDAPLAEPNSESGPTAPTTQPTTAKTVEDPAKDIKKLEPIIIFLTDGDPTVGETDPARIINRITEKNSGVNKAAIFCLAFGEDADRKFLRKLSLRSDGFMRHIYEAADAALQLRDFYRQVSSPLLADVTFSYPPEQIKEGSLTKNKFRMFYAGSETIVAGRVADGAEELAPHVYGICGVDDSFIRKKYEIFPKVPVKRDPNDFLPLERLWAYLTVKQLLDERDALDSTADKNKEDGPEKRALKIALKYEFVTPLTSLVVVKPNATDSLQADSGDKQYGPGAIPLAVGGAAPMYASFAARPLDFAHSQVLPASVPNAYPGQPLFDSFDLEQFEDTVDYSDGGAGAPGMPGPPAFRPSGPYLTTPLPGTEAPAATVSPLEAFHLVDYQWVLPALKPGSDVIGLVLDGANNQTTVDLELTRDTEVPKAAEDEQCARATDGADGVCVYITRCDAARNITLDDYKQTYCQVNNKYAGVCCPKSKVDVPRN